MREVLTYLGWKRVRCLSRYYTQRALYLAGNVLPDLRDQDLRDRGAELEWRRKVAINNRNKRELARREAARLAARRAEWEAA